MKPIEYSEIKRSNFVFGSSSLPGLQVIMSDLTPLFSRKVFDESRLA